MALDPSVVAVVNGVVLSRESYERQLAQAQRFLLQRPDLSLDSEEGKRALQDLEQQVLAWMIDQILLQQAAAAEGIAIGSERVDEEIARMRGGDARRYEEWLAANGLTEEMLREQLRMDLLTAAMRDRVTSAQPRARRHVHVRHILVSEASTAETLRLRLLAGESFAAQLVEIDPERIVSEEYWPMVQHRIFEDWMAQQRARSSIQRSTP
jgi:parvulin-like peptidyl-prolyl isomerase